MGFFHQTIHPHPADCPAVPPPPRAYPAGATNDELRTHLLALGRSAAALLEADPDLTITTIRAAKEYHQEALRVLFLMGVERAPREDYGGPMPFPFSGCAADNRPSLQVAKTLINAEADRLDRVQP